MDDRTRFPDPAPETAPAGQRHPVLHGLIAVTVLVAGIAAGTYFLGTDVPVGEREPPERSARLVEIARAESGTRTVTVTAWGEVQASRTLDLKPRETGRVDWLNDGFSPGGLVTAGAALVRLERDSFNVDLRRSMAALTRAKADLALERGQQAVAKREYELLDQPAGDAERGLMLRRPQLSSAEAAVSAAEADVADARRALGNATLAAPFDALVQSRDITVGAEVTTSTAVARLVGIRTWWIELAVPAAALKWIRFPEDDQAGSTVRLTYDGVWSSNDHRTGRVIRLLGDLEENGRLARVLVAVDDPLARAASVAGPRLLLGAFMRADIRGRELADTVAIPPGWLRPDDTVWIMGDNDRLALREVTVAYRDAGRVLVSDGLDEGERIVTSPLALPTEGMPLRTAEPAAAANTDRPAPGGPGHGV